MNLPPWTYSQLETYDTCPKQYFHKYVAKDFKDRRTEHNIWGDRVHDALEKRIQENVSLPEGMPWEPLVAKLNAIPGEKIAEKQYALGRDFTPTGYKSKDAWTRGKVDLTILHEDRAAVFDYKTGKIKPSEQLTLYAAYAFAYYPQVRVVHTGFIWLREKKITKDEISRESLPFIWQSFVARVSRIETAHSTNSWPERPSGLCNGWCPVKVCKYYKPPRD